MPIYRGLVTIKRLGRYHPPGTLFDLTEAEAKDIGPTRVVLVKEQVAAVANVALDSASMPAGLEPAGGSTGDAPSAVVAPPASQQTDGASTRIAEIASAIDLLDEKKDFWKSGARMGKPKLKPLLDVVGLDGVTDAEIDAAMALRESGV
ncbi:hypothetical protein ACQR1W_18025 [Bradyrhizobium sp. HKCCYLS1011]|uniref:hypothetical protein n=1 Tax=Bradyrhizobium sp. HKCCYLS1011 TaxID=3420733 RepID=UPI003EC006D1